MAIPRLAGLGVLAPRYDLLLCDVWGVIHNGRRAHPAAVGALKRFRQQREGSVVLVTNSPRPASVIEQDFAALGVPRNCWDRMVSSGDVTRALIGAYAGRAVHRVGPRRDDPLFEDLPVTYASADEADVLVVTDLNGDEETPADYATRLAEWNRRGLTMICANPDLMVEVGDRLVYCGGALAAEYEKIGGKVVMAGKPFAPIYEAALGPHDRSRALAVGDSARTDAAGAAAAGLDFLFIAGAMHRADFGESPDESQIAALLAPTGVRALGFMTSLKW
jgi:HAD superfamily hydrolase (TIGR01459 family)